MSVANASVTAFWGDGEKQFRIAVRERLEIERLGTERFAAIDPRLVPLAALPKILERTLRREVFAGEARDVLRQARIGGGATPKEADADLNAWGPGARPDEEWLPILLQVLSAAIYIPEDVLKKSEGASAEAPTTSGSSPQPSTPTRHSPGTRSPKSKTSRAGR